MTKRSQKLTPLSHVRSEGLELTGRQAIGVGRELGLAHRIIADASPPAKWCLTKGRNPILMRREGSPESPPPATQKFEDSPPDLGGA